MILCLNLNAAIDKTVTVSGFRLGHIHRPESVQALPGGKGCNVARALKTLGATPVVTGWVGGSAGQFIDDGLQAEGIATSFVWTNNESRTCLSVLDPATQSLTEIYEKGEPVIGEFIAALRQHFTEIVGNYTAVTLSGSLPPGVPADFYADLIRIATAASVTTLLDSSRDALKSGIEAMPTLVKPNQSEVVALLHQPLPARPTLADYTGAITQLAERYSTVVVLSLGKQGALVAEKSQVVHVQNPPVPAVSAVGSGDSMVAGIAYSLTRDQSTAEAVRYGVAAGTANTLTVGAGKFSLADFEHVHRQTTINVL